MNREINFANDNLRHRIFYQFAPYPVPKCRESDVRNNAKYPRSPWTRSR